MRDVFIRGIVPAEIVVAVGEVDVGFMEDAGVLEWRLDFVSEAVRERMGGLRHEDADMLCNDSTC